MDKLPRHSTLLLFYPNSVVEENEGVWCYFRDFVAAQIIEDLTETKNFSRNYFK